MALVCLWLVAGVMLGSIPACCLGRHVPWSHSLENRKIFNPLRQLKSIPSHSCLNDRTDFQFPWERGYISQVEKTQGTCLHYLMLRQTLHLFSTENSCAAWNHSLLDELLSSLDHSMEQLRLTEEETRLCPDLGILVRNYFHGIHNYLKKKKYSPCAWEVVRGEIEVRLSLM